MEIKSKTKASVTGEQIARLCVRHFGMPCKSCVELNDGYFNRAYLLQLVDGKEMVLKIAPPADVDILGYEKDIMRTEVTFFELASGYPNVPVPEILASDFHCSDIPYPFYFMHRLPGIPLNKIGDISAEMRRRIYEQKAAILARLHAIKGDTFGYASMRGKCQGKSYFDCFKTAFLSLIDDGHRRHTGFPLREGELLELLESTASAFNDVKVPSMVHFDLWDGNIFVRSKTDLTITGIIDFERGFYGDPAADLCQAAGYIDLDRDRYFFDAYNACAAHPILWDTAMKVRTYMYRVYLLVIMHVECFYRDINGSFEPQKKWVQEEFPKVHAALQRALRGSW